MIAVVVSEADEASEHVGDHLLELRDWETRVDGDRPGAEGGGEFYVAGEFELRTFEALHLELVDAADAFGPDGERPDLLAFASRHSGETGPLLTAHFTGNFGPAEFGGRPGRLAEAAPGALDAVVSAFEDHAPEGYDVGIECTHHGPSRVGCPSLFVEVGSAEPEWRDPGAARAVARSILALEGVDPHRERTVVGVGGGHYAPRFLRVVRETAWSVGHVASDWAIEAMADAADGDATGDPDRDDGGDAPVELDDRRDVLRRAFERSGATRALVDGDYPDLEATVEDLGYEVVSETWLRAVDGRPLELVAAVEERLGPVEGGVRFGDLEADPGGFEVVDLPAELVAEAGGIDAGATREAVASNAVAFETREGASRVGDRAAVAGPEGYDAVVEALVAVLEADYESVRREDGAVVAEETAFDPELAREAGVPEGPAFGKLSAGRAVELDDGRTVDPGEVHRERTRRFPV